MSHYSHQFLALRNVPMESRWNVWNLVCQFYQKISVLREAIGNQFTVSFQLMHSNISYSDEKEMANRTETRPSSH